jgi:hypothetical protein
MNNAGTMAEMIEAAMKKKEGPKDSFTMDGQLAGPVQRDEDREFVVYEAPNGEMIQVYGNWNEFAVDRNAEGLDLIAQENYPIVRNEDGEYILDEAAYERMVEEMRMESEEAEGQMMQEEMMQREMMGNDEEEEEEEEEMPEEEEEEEGMMMGGGKMMYAEGGMLSSDDKKKGKKATPEQAYQILKSEYEDMREDLRNKDFVTKKEKMELGLAYNNMRRALRKRSEAAQKENPVVMMGGGMMPMKRKY